MLRKSETAKKCLCPVMYDSNIHAMKGHSLTDEQVKEVVNCLAENCMAWQFKQWHCFECDTDKHVEGDICTNCKNVAEMLGECCHKDISQYAKRSVVIK